MLKKDLFNLSLCFFTIFLFYGCEQASFSPEKTTVFSGNAMTIDYKIIVGKDLSNQQKDSVDAIISEVFSKINVVYNKWNPDSEISKLNRLQKGQTAVLSSELEFFLKEVENLVALTEGRFDPTIEPLQELWKVHLQNGTTPPLADIEKISETIGWKRIHFENGVFFKDHDLTSLDLGGVAKGLCVDMLVEALVNAGYPDIFVEWGGEIKAHGMHPENRPWHIFISRLGSRNPEEAIDTIALYNQAIATSGDYLQCWEIFDKHEKSVFFHIINPKTLEPLKITSSSIASASVLAPSCAFADALATAVMMFPNMDEAGAWTKKISADYPDIKIWAVSRE